VSSQWKRHWVGIVLTALLTMILAGNSSPAFGQQPAITRKVKTKVAPIYPEIARRMGLGGTVRLIVVVASNGSVKSTQVLGGQANRCRGNRSPVR